MGSKIEARERMHAAGVPIIPGVTRPVESAEEVRRLGDELGWPIAIKASAGGGGKGLKVVRDPAEVERRVRVGATRGRGVLLRFGRLRRAIPRGSAPRRGASARGCPRQRHPPRRARLHYSAPPSEARRGDALARRRQRVAGTDRRDRRRRRASSRLPECGNDRGPALARRRVLLPGDEHAHPGRAHGDGDGDRARSRARASVDRGGATALRAAGRRAAARSCVGVPDQRGGRLQRFPSCAGNDHAVPRAERAGRARRLRRRCRQRDLSALRPDDREARGSWRRSRACAAPDAACTRRVRGRGSEDVDRLSQGVADASMLRRGRDVPWPRRVRAARGARGEFENGRPVGAAELGATAVRESVRSVEVDGRRFEVRVLRPEPAYAELGRRRRERARGGGAAAAGSTRL